MGCRCTTISPASTAAFTSATSSNRSTADRPHAVLEQLHPGLAVALGGVHGEVGVLQRPRARLVLATGQAQARADAQVAPGHGERHLEGGEHPLREQRALGDGRIALDEDGELVTTDPGDGVPEADARAQSLADRGEQAVPGVVAEAVVDRLEVVQVDEEDRHRLIPPLLERVVEPITEERPVGQERERVVEGLELELHLPLLQLGDRPLEVPGELAVLEDRHHLAHDEQDRDDAARRCRGTVRRRPRTSNG